MEFEFTNGQRRLREEVHAFLEQEVPSERQAIYGQETEEQYQFGRAVARKLATKGWLTIGWPKEYGGGDQTAVEQGILNEEVGYHRVPRVGTISMGVAGPALMKFGTEEQKRQYLPPIAKGEVDYCQGFTEPNAGSDLAALEMRAVREGDEYILNGSKMFTSYAFHADYIYLLARTDPAASKHKGLSLFIVDVKTPGIVFHPLLYINGEMSAQTFFNDARVSASCLVGEENQGWYHAMTSLDFERSGLERYAGVQRTFDDFMQFCHETRYKGNALADDPIVRHRLAEIKIGLQMWRLLCWKVAWLQSQGRVPNYEASAAFLHGTEERLRFAQAAIQILGLYGVLRSDSPWVHLSGNIEGIYRESLHLHGAGTMEIHRNIIAQRGLGMPR